MLPEGFIKRMTPILGEEAEALFHALTEHVPVRAFRVGHKAKDTDVSVLLKEFSPRPIPYEKNGYYFDGEGIGNTPLHHAGGIYVQDPGAMAALCAVDVPEDARVLDVCAAPGGKSSQALKHLTTGFLISNEIIPSRAKITVSNMERLGYTHSMVTCMDTDALASLYEAYFDLVIVDAPCSGEGMFRKNEQALSEWSEEAVLRCAERQAYILDRACTTVAAGGRLLYSTCTFSPEENELTVDAFLDRHPDFHLVAPHPRTLPFTAPGLDLCYKHIKKPEYCRRFYPHISPGEGQFFAVLERDDVSILPTIHYKNALSAPSKATVSSLQTFIKDTLRVPNGLTLGTLGDRPILAPPDLPVPPRGVFSAGVLLGELRGSILRPHHSLFSALGHAFHRQTDLLDSDPRLGAYLRGEEIADTGEDGYCAVLYEGMPLGGGKRTGGRVKNHYPKGLRRA